MSDHNADECKRFAGERDAFMEQYPAAKSLGWSGREFIPSRNSYWQLQTCAQVNALWECWQKARAARPAPVVPDVDDLANFIRHTDGNHKMGAGALAERICDWLAAPSAAALTPAQTAPIVPEALRKFIYVTSESGPRGFKLTLGFESLAELQAARGALAAAPAQGQRISCHTCRDSGIVGHSDLCPDCNGEPAQGQQVEADVRCEGCGYMTYHREHMGCVKAARELAALKALHGGELGLPSDGWPAYHKRKMETLRDLITGTYERKLAALKAQQAGEIPEATEQEIQAYKLHIKAQQVGQEPVAAQVRFRRPEKGTPDWSPWQPAAVSLSHPAWTVDSVGWEVEYRLLYTTPQPAPAQDVAGWIPVSERLPELDTHVWLYCPGEAPFFGMRESSTDGWMWVEGTGLSMLPSGPEFADITLNDCEPTHWMPLPSAPSAHDKQSGEVKS
jgi:hypothetical protein